MEQAGGDGTIERGLAKADQRLGALIKAVLPHGGQRRLEPSTASSHFDAIARSIIYQQLSKNVAASIYSRFLRTVKNASEPAPLLEVRPQVLQRAGLSGPKIRYLKGLAEAVRSGELPLAGIEELPDKTIIERLTQVPGIGMWTAQMFLIFRLQRPDVLPLNDVGIQRGVQLAHGLRSPAAPCYVERVGKKWAPHRSFACLYLWAAVDLGIKPRNPRP